MSVKVKKENNGFLYNKQVSWMCYIWNIMTQALLARKKMLRYIHESSDDLDEVGKANKVKFLLSHYAYLLP